MAGITVGDLARRQQLEIGDELADGDAGVAGVATELALELEAARVTEGAGAELGVRALHLGAAVEQPIDLREREQADAALRQVVGHGEQAGEEPGVVAADLIGSRGSARTISMQKACSISRSAGSIWCPAGRVAASPCVTQRRNHQRSARR